MNTRYKELWSEALSNKYINSGRSIPDIFAELIVKECMDVLDPGQNQLIARFQARQYLSEHFGVK